MNSELSEIQKIIISSLSSSSKLDSEALRMIANNLGFANFIDFSGPLLQTSTQVVEYANRTNKLDQLIQEVYKITNDLKLVSKWNEWQNKFARNNSGGGAYIGGNVVTSGTYNNPNIQIGGDANNSIIIAGDGNIVGGDNVIRVKNDELINLIREIKRKLDTVNISSDELQELKDDISKIERQLEKPKPNKTIIIERLKSASEFIKSVSGIAPTLIDLVQKAVTTANKYFF